MISSTKFHILMRLLVVVIIMQGISLASATYTETGFRYPTGTSGPYGYAGWLAGGPNIPDDYYDGVYHLGQDMEADLGDPVYPIADGEIVYISVNDWGENNYGILVKHRLNTGEEFLALYGHVRPIDASLRYSQSGPVSPAVEVSQEQAFATIGPWSSGNHLHFGIHPGTQVPNNHWGSMPIAQWPETNGFVDPIEWITTRSPFNTVSPNLPVSLTQYNSDGSTGIPLGDTTTEDTVIMKGVVSDPNEDNVQLEVEVRPLGTAFTGTPTCTSAAVVSGEIASATCTGLANGQYHWQARARDSAGNTGPWLSAGGNSEDEPDFIVQVSNGRTGGPDYFGYKFKDSNTIGGPTYDWIEISETGTMILPSSDDYYVDNIPVGFFFNYYGTDYSQVSITNNGITLASGGTSQYSNQHIGISNPHNFIAPFWDDIVTWGSAGAVYYQVMGEAPNRKFVVEWFDNQHYSSSPSGITFEAILYEGTNDIKFQYKDVDFGSDAYNNGASATVGIEGADGRGLEYSYNEPVISPNMAILFKFPAFSGTNMYISKNAPASKDHGSLMTYTLYYNNFGSIAASNVVVQDTLPSNVEFESASDGGTYDPATRQVTWNVGSVEPLRSGSRTVSVRIPDSVSVGTVIQNTASISTTTLETRYDDNSASASTTVTGSNLPPDVSVEPNNGGSGTTSIYWQNPITFSYHSDQSVTAVDITIHINDGGPDITGSMTPIVNTMTAATESTTEGSDWTYTTTFYPRHGSATVSYAVSGGSCQSVTTPTPPSTIRVLRTETGQVEEVAFKDYIKNVLPNEWYPSWNMEALKAGAVAAKTYAWYWTIHQKYPGQNYDVKDSTGDQRYIPGTATSRTDQAVEETWNEIMTKNGEIFQAQYDSGTSGSPDPLNAGRLSQWGTQYWAEQGKDWQWILHNYYDPVCIRSTVSFNIYIDPAGYIYDLNTGERIAGAYVWLQRPDGIGGWENVPTGESTPAAQPDINPQVTGEDGMYQWDVLEGSYRVHVEAPGYEPANSIVVSVPPPVFDLHVGLISTNVPPTNVPPVADAGGPYSVDEASPVNFDASASYDPDGDSITYEWDFNNDGIFEVSSSEAYYTYTWNDDYTGIISLRVIDDGDLSDTASAEVAVNNVAPVVGSGNDLEVTAGDLVSFSGTFSDPGWLDTHTAEWNFGEGTLEVGSVSEENEYPDSTGTVSGSFSYFDAGDYTVTLNASDDDGGIGQDQLTVTVLPIVATVNFDPDTLNIGSGGEWVTAYIELPEGYDVAGINASSVLLNGTVSAVTDPKYEFVTNESEYIQDFDGDLTLERMLKFDREEVEAVLEAGEEVTVTLAGKVEYDNGISSGMASFEGSDVITVIEKKKDKTKK